MATAVTVEIPVQRVVRERFGDVVAGLLTEQSYLAAITAGRSNTTTTALLQDVGGGFYQWHPRYGTDLDCAITNWSFTGAADHHYLIYPQGTMRAMTAIRASATATAGATDTNPATVLTNSGATFTSGTAVAVGDVVTCTLTGATAEVTEVTSATVLATTALAYGQTFGTGTAYIISRPPGTDTAASYSVTVREVYLLDVYVRLLTQLRTWRALQPDVAVGNATVNATSAYDRVMRELGQMIGVTSA